MACASRAIFGAWWCALLCWLTAGCLSLPPHPTDAEPLTRLQPKLGTFVSVTVYAADTPETQAAINAAFAEIDAVDQLLSIHRADSALARANAGGPVNDELHNVLKSALAIARQTEGAFDPTIRPLADLWGFIKKDGFRLPTDAELQSVLPKVDYRKVNVADGRLRFAAEGMSIDSGGFGKGYAVDRAIAALQRHGVRNAMVKAGGDLRVIGRPPGRRHWTVWIEDPEKKGRRVKVKLAAGALSTSGNYENSFTQNSRRYGHLLDPRTGQPVDEVAACTVTAPTCLESDAYATAACILGVKRSRALLGDQFGLRFVTLSGQVIEHRPPPSRR